ncbi:lysis protein [Escherichia phage T7]|nr:lysis protein [Escherichia phage T7]
MLEFLRKLIPWVLAGMLFGLGWHLGSDSMDAKWKQEVHNEYVKRVEPRRVTHGFVRYRILFVNCNVSRKSSKEAMCLLNPIVMRS